MQSNGTFIGMVIIVLTGAVTQDEATEGIKAL
jgi:hypothetical protein